MVAHPNRKRSPGHTVTLIRIRTRFSNIVERFAVMQPGHMVDETCESVEVYYLPEGYRVAPSTTDQLYVYDPRGEHCEIVCHPTSLRPQLVNDGRDMPVLKRKVAV